MSEIILKLDSDVYVAGDTIHGAVYLKVNGPTSGYGIKVSTKGRESYSYHDLRSLTIATANEDCVIKKDIVLLDEQLILCMLKCPFAIGQYVLPFKQILPRHLPGSFEQCSWYGPQWDAHLGYQITAEVIGSEQVKASIPVRVSALYLCDHCPTVSVKHQVQRSKFLRVMKAEFSLDVRLDNPTYCVGDTIKITTQLNSSAIPIKHICIKLLRSLGFLREQSSSSDRAACLHCNPNSEGSLGGQWRTANENDILWPEDGVKVVWSTSISYDKTNMRSQVPAVFLPISEDGMGFALQPSTHGQFIQCHYIIQLDIVLEIGDMRSIQIPLPHIGLKKTASMMHDKSDWMGICTLILPDDDLLEGEGWTDWDVYTKLAFPTLQLMRSPGTRRRLTGKPRSSPLAQVLKLSTEIRPCGSGE